MKPGATYRNRAARGRGCGSSRLSLQSRGGASLPIHAPQQAGSAGSGARSGTFASALAAPVGLRLRVFRRP